MFTIKIIVSLVLMLILLLGTLLFFIHTAVSIIDLFRNSAPYVPLRDHAIEKLVNEITVNEDSVVYDLGAGDGRVLYHLAKSKMKGVYIGVERSPAPLLFSLYYRFLLRGKKYNFIMKNADFFDVSVTDATHVVMYLFPKLMDALLPKLQAELKKGTLVYAVDFKFSNMEPIRTVDISSALDGTGLGKTLFIYQF